MQAGQTMVGTSGRQVALFPMDICNITQLSGSSSLSHCCGHPFDAVGSSGSYPIYAPCDCHLIYSDSVGNTRGYQSDSEVEFASGVGYICFSFTHDNNPPSKTSFKQGELIGHTGTAGMVTGDHSHIDQAVGQNKTLVSYGITCAFGNLCYALQDSTSPQNIWYINDTQIVNTQGLTFKTYEGGSSSVLNWIVPEETRPLNTEEMQNNAKCFYGYMNIMYGMTLNAVCGILGNAQSESTINPNRWQGDDPWHEPPDSWGFGLVQWTPYTKIVEWLQQLGVWETDYIGYGNAECQRLKWELDNNEQWISTTTYPMTFQEYWESTRDAGDLAIIFLANYERPFDPNQPIRATQAREWYEYLKDWTPILPGSGEKPKPKKKKGMPLYMMISWY